VSDDEPEGVHWASEYSEARERRDERSQLLLDAVRLSFDADELVRNEPIFIAARGGEVTLSGEASSGYALDRALLLASEVEDVESVVSRVVVEVLN
jgi:osmotically-inducible protein OsmY